MKKALFISLGFFFVGVGAVGAVLPVLPTTPFLLLVLYFFSKGSKRFELWFTSTKLYKKYLEAFVQTRSMTLGTKIKLLSFASSVLLVSAFMVDILPFRIFIVFLMAFKYYYFFYRIKTIPSPKRKAERLAIVEALDGITP